MLLLCTTSNYAHPTHQTYQPLYMMKNIADHICYLSGTICMEGHCIHSALAEDYHTTFAISEIMLLEYKFV